MREKAVRYLQHDAEMNVHVHLHRARWTPRRIWRWIQWNVLSAIFGAAIHWVLMHSM